MQSVWHFMECLERVCKELVRIIFPVIRRQQNTRTGECASSEERVLIKLRYAVPRLANPFNMYRR